MISKKNIINNIILLISIIFLYSCSTKDSNDYIYNLKTPSGNDFHLDKLVWNYKMNFTKFYKFEHGNYQHAELLPFDAFCISLRLYKQNEKTYMAVFGYPHIPALFEDDLLFYTAQGPDTCFFFSNSGVDISVIDELTENNYRITDNDYGPTYKERYRHYLNCVWGGLYEQVYIYGEDMKWHLDTCGYNVAKYYNYNL